MQKLNIAPEEYTARIRRQRLEAQKRYIERKRLADLEQLASEVRVACEAYPADSDLAEWLDKWVRIKKS